ncbi:MAG: VOC family protein [Acidobacteriota bacterium]
MEGVGVSEAITSSGSRLPDETRVGGVTLQVADLGRSVDYYREVIGLRVLDASGDPAALGAPGSAEPLVTLRAVPGTRPAPRRGAFGLFHFAILLPDRGALARFVGHIGLAGSRLSALSSGASGFTGMADHLVSEAIYLSDPDGLGIEVYADRPRDTWRYRDRELVMATNPLDVEDLLSAAGDAAWDGVPAGTTMGHVHLHVGHLGEAAAFYQRTLGLDITVSGYPGALFYAAGGYHHHLGTNTWSPGPAPAPDQAQLLEWSLIVPSPADADAAGQRLLNAGYRAAADGGAWLARDPWGTPVRVTAGPS